MPDEYKGKHLEIWTPASYRIEVEGYPGVTSIDKATVKNSDGSYDVYIGPKKPDGKVNWNPDGPQWNMLWRIYGPLQARYDKKWRPSEIELVK